MNWDDIIKIHKGDSEEMSEDLQDFIFFLKYNFHPPKEFKSSEINWIDTEPDENTKKHLEILKEFGDITTILESFNLSKELNNNLNKDFIIKPGDTIEETLECIKMSMEDFSIKMNKTIFEIEDLISGKEPLTNDIAMQLESVLGIPAQFWIKREKTYREDLLKS